MFIGGENVMDFYNPIEQPARIKLVHAVSMAQPVDVYLNDRPVIRGLAYRQSTQYIPVPKGMYNVKIYSTSGNQLLLNQNLNIAGSKLVTVTTKEGTDALMLKVTEEKMGLDDQLMPYTQPGMMQQYGMDQHDMMQPGMMQPGMMQQYGMDQQDMMPQCYMQPQYGMQPRPQSGMIPQYGMQQQAMQPGMQLQYGMQQPMDDDWMGQQPIPGCIGPQCGYQTPYQVPDRRDNVIKDSARVRFIHFSPNAPAVDITLPNGTVLFRNVPYKAVTDYINVAAGTYTLQVRPTGTDIVVLTVPNVVLLPNDLKSIYAIGLVDDVPRLEAVILNDRTMML